MDRLRIGFIEGRAQAHAGWRAALAANAGALADADSDLDALVVTSTAPEALVRAKAALERGKAVLHATPAFLRPEQIERLVAAARRGGALLRFAEPFRYHPGFTFLQRLLTGDEPFWRLRCLRSTNMANSRDGAPLEALVAEELTVYDALIERPALRVSAASRSDVNGARTLSLTIEYAGGVVAHCTAGLGAHHRSERRLLATMEGREISLDWNDRAEPLRFSGAAVRPCRAAPGSARACDPALAEVTLFLEAVRARHHSPTNGPRWERVAAIRRAARESICLGETVELPGGLSTESEELCMGVRRTKPPLRVIRGGGRSGRAAHRRPALTVVRR